MGNRRTYRIEKRIIVSEFDDELSILSPPKRRFKYLFEFVLWLGLTLYAPIYLIFILPNDDIDNSILYSLLAIMAPFTLGGIYPTIKLLINGIDKNFFLSEELVINRDYVKYYKNGSVQICLKYEDINSIMFYGVKKVERYIEIFDEAYKHMVAINDKKTGRINKIFRSITNKESTLMFGILCEKLTELNKNIEGLPNEIIVLKDNNKNNDWQGYSKVLYRY